MFILVRTVVLKAWSMASWEVSKIFSGVPRDAKISVSKTAGALASI